MTLETETPIRRAVALVNAARICPECGETFTATHGRQVFCCPAHKETFHQTMKVRGKVSAPFITAWRMGKRGRTGTTAYAFYQLSRMADLWREEDAKTGRRPELMVALRAENGWTFGDDQFTPYGA